MSNLTCNLTSIKINFFVLNRIILQASLRVSIINRIQASVQRKGEKSDQEILKWQNQLTNASEQIHEFNKHRFSR